jgi:glycosyltransferase involved in cell wall biosynthesis
MRLHKPTLRESLCLSARPTPKAGPYQKVWSNIRKLMTIPDAIVLIPAFNEGSSIATVVSNVRSRCLRVLVIDDGSSDDTAQQANESGAMVLRHPANLGQGAALETGFEWVRRNHVTWAITLDADGQHDPDDALRMLRQARDHGLDVCLGSRFLGRAEGIPLSRRLLLKAALKIQNITSGLQLTDVHNGLRVLNRKAIQHIRLRQDRMAHASEIISQLANSGLKVGEGPVTIRYTEYSLAKGQTAMGALNIVVDLLIAKLGR